MSAPLSTLLLVPLAAAAAPLLGATLNRFVKIPLVVFEILLGLILGPSILGWIKVDDFTSILADLGLAMLFFLAGNEINFAAIRGRNLNRASVGWLISLVAGVVAGILIAPNPVAGVFIGIALTSTALGTLMPVLRDAGEMKTPFGRAVTAIGAAGEFGPLLAISLFLSGRTPLIASIVLIAFALITGLSILLAAKGSHHGLHRLIAATLHTSGQFAVRFVLVVIAALAVLSVVFGLDMLLGAFAAGVLCRVVLSGAASEDRAAVETKLEAVGFGFLVPIFFINTGLTFDLKSLIGDPRLLLLLPIILVLLLIVRGLPGMLTAPAGASWADRRAVILFSATGLPIIVAVTGIGVERHVLDSGTAAALIGAGMLSVLLFPLVALAQHRRALGGVLRPPDREHVAEEA
ncbi:cation:proton antiporter [Rathayibacter soli]|uniref:cation:proton antiporter n=1 Tax=Rathayibacter soli TaxID=3144168 RepID=UPI0027E5BC39|nr:cation:proton antiporter [Glaciibacter superstes]